MQFSAVIGQDSIKNKLVNESKGGRVPHAQLFIGGPGCGNLPLALAYAQFVNCENPSENDSCGVCSSCVKASKMIHPDIHFAFPVVSKKTGKSAISNDYINEFREFVIDEPYQNVYQWLQYINAENKQGNITVDECREIIRKLSLKTYEARYKVMIIWMPEYLGHIGNVLLKIIEEPADDTIFILIAENQELILNTIISRTQLVKIPPIADDKIADEIQKRFELDSDSAKKLALLSDGNFIESLKIATQESNVNEGTLKEWLNACYRKDPKLMVKWSDEMGKEGREKQKNFVRYVQFILRESMLESHANIATLRRVSGSEEKLSQTLAQFLDLDQMEQFYGLLTDIFFYIERNANPRIQFMNLSLQLSKLLKS